MEHLQKGSGCRTGKLIRVGGKMGGVKYRQFIPKDKLMGAKYLNLGWTFTFHLKNNPKHTARELKADVHRCSSLNAAKSKYKSRHF